MRLVLIVVVKKHAKLPSDTINTTGCINESWDDVSVVRVGRERSANNSSTLHSAHKVANNPAQDSVSRHRQFVVLSWRAQKEWSV